MLNACIPLLHATVPRPFEALHLIVAYSLCLSPSKNLVGPAGTKQ